MGRGRRGPGPAGRAPPGVGWGRAARPARRRPRPAHLGRARLGHRPLQLPLPVLHARRRPALAPARRGPDASRSSSASSRVLASMGVDTVRLTGGEPLVRRDFPRLAGMLAAVPGVARAVGHHERLPARARRAGARGGRGRALQRLDRLAAARPLLRDDAARRPAARPARPRGARRVPRGAPDQGQRRGHARASPRTRCCPSRASPASTPTRCASSSSCRSTPTTPGRPTAS